MYCKNCGNKIKENTNFCTNCGKKTNDNLQMKTPNKKEKNYKIPFAIVTSILATIIVSIISFVVLIIAALVFDEFEETKNYIPGYAELKYNEEQITFKVPNEFKAEEEEMSDDNQTFYNWYGEYITYSLDYNYDNYYDIQKTIQMKYYSKEYKNSKIGEYSVPINNEIVKVFFITYTFDEDKYTDTYAFYPISNDYIVQIILSINDVNQTNLEEYIKPINNLGIKI